MSSASVFACFCVMSSVILISGGPKPKSVDQTFLVGMVVDFVQKMLPRFIPSDILYVRSMRASKMAVLNVQCRSTIVAGQVKCTFAALVKQTVKPSFIGEVNVYVFIVINGLL